ncbi:hypothetical protein [Micromonospora sp. L32]|uniref:hypothetical protein n=1 Tax=unclassified Micromonospora TaxID=2617518 RepID=UPI003F8989EE
MRPGATIIVPEADYAFGAGPLRMRVEEVVGQATHGGERWAELRGHDVRPDGSVDPRERYASVRVDRVTVIA